MAGARPGAGRPPISTLPSTRPDIGSRPGAANRPGVSKLPAAGLGAAAAGAAGAGIANRMAERPAALPGLGGRGPGASQLPANRTPQQRRDALQNRLAGETRPGQAGTRDWNQTRQDWQSNRDQVREDWQQHRDEARDDWQNFFDDHYGRYGGWYGGYAPGYWGRWDYLWDNHPVAAAVGLTWWGANRLGSMFGYSDYSNPYYADSMPSVYSEPIITPEVDPSQEFVDSAPTALPPGGPADAVSQFDQARNEFLEGRYDEALKLTDAAIVKMPQDAVLHEFRSLVLFSLQRFAESAAAIHPVLAVGPTWDWKTLSSLYSGVDVYTNQLRVLESAWEKNPNGGDLAFLLGYHYLTCGHSDNALLAFRQASQLQPKDAVAASMVATLGPRDAEPAVAPAAPAPKPIPADSVVGIWRAEGPRSTNYSMTLTKDGKFTWTYVRGSRKQDAQGVYTVEGNVLAMEPDAGGVLVAELTASEPDRLLFKMVGGAKDDPGLDFRRRPQS